MSAKTSTFTLGEADLAAMASRGVARTYPEGTIVVTEGDVTDSLYVILEGRVKVYASDEQGREVVFLTQGRGEYFGELVLEEGVRAASVMTLEKSRFLVVPRHELLEFVAGNPAFALNMMRKLINRVRALSANVKSLALMDVYGRVARLLLELAEEEDGALVIHERFTQQDIASRVGASREMVGRILKDLSVGGYVVLQRNRIVINRRPPEHW
jgi:CRP/FNR family transcriptional regulator, cyclic AMP receptor protein